jgi:hypothetical protein
VSNASDDDALSVLLAQLPRAAPREESVKRVRARSHRLLAERRRVPKHGFWMGMVDVALAVVSVTYLAGAIGQVITIKRLLP